MRIPIIDIFKIHKELDTASAPLFCTCIDSDGNFVNYYLKYTLDENIYCGLVYEIICSRLATYMNINTPQIALAKAGTIIENNVKVNRNYLLKPESICFASKEIIPNKMISNADEIKDKTMFNRYDNPEQFLKIVLFDLWVAHDDRNSLNYNLLAEISHGGYYNFYSIDHYHCFGGETYFQKDFSELNANPYKSIITSSFGLSIHKYLVNPQILDNIVESFINLDLDEIRKIVADTFIQLPEGWKIDSQLQDRIIRFITNKKRNTQVIEVFKHLTTT